MNPFQWLGFHFSMEIMLLVYITFAGFIFCFLFEIFKYLRGWNKKSL